MLTKVGKDSTQTAPKVSVVMGIYNCARTLRDAIESVLHQSYGDWELILCDAIKQIRPYFCVLAQTVKKPEKDVYIGKKRAYCRTLNI